MEPKVDFLMVNTKKEAERERERERRIRKELSFE